MFRPFPSKLHHQVPSWVEDGALFHIRIAIDRTCRQQPLTDPELAGAILQSAMFYQENHRWHITLFVLLPDHLHALLTFPINEAMSRVVGGWKRFHARKNRVIWQEGYFDHRLRDDERGQQLSIKMDYIRQNPVIAGLCAKAGDWRWIIDPLGGSSSPLLDCDRREL
jgi:REP element-mobilizing transposase RayT